MKKRTVLILTLCLLLQQLAAQEGTPAKTNIRVWNITEQTASVVPTVLDTSLFEFQNTDPMNRYSIANAYNGSLGSPLQSKIYFDRTEKNNFLFSRPYDAYFVALPEMLFFNTTVPYSNLEYFTAGSEANSDENFRGIFSINANKRFNFSGLYHYAGTRGLYNNQATKMTKIGLWATYSGKHYGATGVAMRQVFNNEENGGIKDEAYIRTDSLREFQTNTIPTNLDYAMSRYTNIYFYLNQKLHIANVEYQIDSTHSEFRPIATISHSIKYETAEKRYLSTQSDAAFYQNTFFDDTKTQDSAQVRSLYNTLAFSVNEGFSRWFPLSIAGYATHEYREYYHLDNTIPVRDYESNILIGAEMSKRQGKHLHFNANGELYTVGDRAGDFSLNGDVTTVFRLWNDTVSLFVEGLMKNTSASYFEETYSSNHFRWDNTFDRTLRTRFRARLGLNNSWLNASAGMGVENVSQLIYFDRNALPAQHDGNIQVLTGEAALNFNVWVFHLHNKAIYQRSSNNDILPLPDLSLYHNAFFAFKMFKKVLHTQLGADVYYNTAYYAPDYMPATGAFFLQSREKVGSFPVISAYAAFHLKTARLFFKYYHLNANWTKNYFSMPQYPIYPGRFKMGISWNLFD
ncbi:MAG: putative porin [Prevotellaceae bacterium]|jgi:hypothetical protein|nr:putative porin [Prevotellaceae bacterium]